MVQSHVKLNMNYCIIVIIEFFVPFKTCLKGYKTLAHFLHFFQNLLSLSAL